VHNRRPDWSATLNPRHEFTAKIHDQLVDRLPAEHIEALLHDACQILLEHPDARTLAVISRGGNAVLFNRPDGCCYVLPLGELKNVDTDAAAQIREWQSRPEGNFFVMELAGLKESN
jgi:hypothetical protein